MHADGGTHCWMVLCQRHPGYLRGLPHLKRADWGCLLGSPRWAGRVFKPVGHKSHRHLPWVWVQNHFGVPCFLTLVWATRRGHGHRSGERTTCLGSWHTRLRILQYRCLLPRCPGAPGAPAHLRQPSLLHRPWPLRGQGLSMLPPPPAEQRPLRRRRMRLLLARPRQAPRRAAQQAPSCCGSCGTKSGASLLRVSTLEGHCCGKFRQVWRARVVVPLHCKGTRRQEPCCWAICGGGPGGPAHRRTAPTGRGGPSTARASSRRRNTQTGIATCGWTVNGPKRQAGIIVHIAELSATPCKLTSRATGTESRSRRLQLPDKGHGSIGAGAMRAGTDGNPIAHMKQRCSCCA